MNSTATDHTTELARYLAMLGASEPAGGLLELRYRNPSQPGTMRQRFHHVGNTTRMAREITLLAAHSDVYVGVAPRRTHSGGRHAVSRSWVLWADIDQAGDDSLLAALPVPPGVVIASGTPGHHHLYWPLREPLAPDELEQANATLARALGADRGAVLGAATILRPPHTLNHKHHPATHVTLERFDLRPHTASEILAGLQAAPAPPARPEAHVHTNGSDPLLTIAPARYIEVLTGQTVGRDHKISCPFHDDSTPSLHVYDDPAKGWCCYGGCRRGGTIYDLAGAVWQLDTRGADFIEIRRRLTRLFRTSDEGQAVPAER